ncbi:hypothetical protein [Flagellimonas pacifica]|uniref:Uncharacterized protein n=1 Tax=Flagellimonas pacifica TaxID=1247520 RepID=A0A285MYQ3_9FLAO|nr:hypothetical protein [Allomuricauda parva]SNZ01667.1 hypothetical protein SAMN06265377_3509 [Allomuricauda parva]
MKGYIIAILLVVCPNSVFSQKIPTRIYDNKTKSFDTVIPVYREVNLRFEDPGNVQLILLVEHCRKKDLDSTLMGEKTCRSTRELKEISSFWTDTIDEKKYLFVRLHQSEDGEEDTFLRPMKNYSLLFFKSSSRLTTLRRAYAKAFVEVNLVEMKDLRKQYEEYENGLSTIETLFSQFPDVFFDNIHLFLSDANNRKKIKSKLYEKECLLKKVVSQGVMNLNEVHNEYNYKYLKQFLFSIDSIQAKNLDIDVKVANQIIQWLPELNLKKINQLLVGELSLANKTDKMENLEDNVENINLLRKLVFNEQTLKDDLTSKALKLALNDLHAKMEGNLEILKKVRNIDQDIDQLIPKPNGEISNIEFGLNPIVTKTSINSFDERIKLKFTPDIGLINYGFQSDFNEISPYLGFHFNLSYLDKDIPFKKLRNKTVWDRLSINLGWALNSIEKSDRREGLIDDGSLLVGLGFRIDHTFRLTFGGNVFYKLDESPISNQRELAVTPYVGLSVDFEVKELLNGFSSIFKND